MGGGKKAVVVVLGVNEFSPILLFFFQKVAFNSDWANIATRVHNNATTQQRPSYVNRVVEGDESVCSRATC